MRHSLDSFALRDTRLFGWGWFLDERAPAERIDLRLVLRDGTVRVVRCPPSGARSDLAMAFPRVPHAVACGFMLQARLPAREDIASIELAVHLANGEHLSIPLPELERACAAGAPEAVIASTPRWWRAWSLLRAGSWRELWVFLRDGLRRRLPARNAGVAAQLAAGSRAWVMFDHDMGGGANRFRDERLAEWRGQGRTVLLVKPVSATLEYEVSGYGADAAGTRRFPNLPECLAALGPCERVVVNDLVSFDDPLRVLAWARARRAEGAGLVFYLHDFHAACPVWVLVGRNGAYCGLPDADECARCLAGNKAPFLGMMPSVDIVAWREAWGAFLRDCSEIVAFSASSIGLLRQAHPALDPARIALKPHSVAYLGAPPRPFRPASDEVATIAVVGYISEYKGAGLVAEMAAIIERERLPARILVVGGIDGVPPSDALRVAGPYGVGDLPGILERERVAVAFLPSIWHETFSYVTAELMHYRVPLAVFDLGAPAERVRDYPLGRIISRIDARTALLELLAFHRELSASADPRAATMDVP